MGVTSLTHTQALSGLRAWVLTCIRIAITYMWRLHGCMLKLLVLVAEFGRGGRGLCIAISTDWWCVCVWVGVGMNAWFNRTIEGTMKVLCLSIIILIWLWYAKYKIKYCYMWNLSVSFQVAMVTVLIRTVYIFSWLFLWSAVLSWACAISPTPVALASIEQYTI